MSWRLQDRPGFYQKLADLNLSLDCLELTGNYILTEWLNARSEIRCLTDEDLLYCYERLNTKTRRFTDNRFGSVEKRIKVLDKAFLALASVRLKQAAERAANPVLVDSGSIEW